MANTILCEKEKNNSIVHRTWGSYEVLIEEARYKVKKIVVFPKRVVGGKEGVIFQALTIKHVTLTAGKSNFSFSCHAISNNVR